MSIFSKIRGAKKAADEHRKSQALKDSEVPKVPYKHVPTHAASDALHIGHGIPSDGLRDQIKAQYRRRSELGPTRSGSDLLTSHAAYRRQSSATSLGDMSIAPVMTAPPMPALPPGVTATPPMKPIHPAKMSNFRHSSYHGPMRSRPPFGTAASGTSLAKGKSPLSTMTNSINEMPEESQEDDSPIESSKHSTKSSSSSSSEGGLEMRYSTPGQSVLQPSGPHTRATSVASRPESQMSPKTIQEDPQGEGEPARGKSPLHLLASPIPELAAPTQAFDAQLEAMDITPTQSINQSPPMQAVNQAPQPVELPAERMSTPVSQMLVAEPALEVATPKRLEEEWFPNYSMQPIQRPESTSTSTPRKSGTNFSRPTVMQEPHSQPHLDLPMEKDEPLVALDFDIPAELISFGQDSAPEIVPQKSQPRETRAQSTFAPIQNSQYHQGIPQEVRQSQVRNQRPFSQQPPVSPAQSYSSPKLQAVQVKPSQTTSNNIPFPTFSPRESMPEGRPTVRMPNSNQYQRRASHQQPMQTQYQQDYFPPQPIRETPETYAQQQLEEDLEYERQQAYQQLSRNDPYYQQQQVQGRDQYSPKINTRSQVPNAPPVPLASKPTSTTKSPIMGPISYTQVVSPVVERPQQQYTYRGSTIPAPSPIMAPVRGPAFTNPGTSTPPLGPVHQRPLLPQKTSPIVTVLNPTPSPMAEMPSNQPAPVQEQPQEKQRKPRKLLRKDKRNSSAVKAF